MDDTIDGLQNKTKLLNINYKIIVFRNVILNHYFFFNADLLRSYNYDIGKIT